MVTAEATPTFLELILCCGLLFISASHHEHGQGFCLWAAACRTEPPLHRSLSPAVQPQPLPLGAESVQDAVLPAGIFYPLTRTVWAHL